MNSEWVERAWLMGLVDWIFPALLTALLVWPLRASVLCMPALAYGALDYAENATRMRFYDGPGAGLPPASYAGELTQTKRAAVALAAAILLLAPARYRRNRSKS